MRTQPRARAELFTIALAAIGSSAFVLARLVLAAKGELSRFVVAGTQWTSPVNHFVHRFANSGYDGQFYWRLAADPFNLGMAPVLGIPFDHALRVNRIFYPFVAWMFSLGQPRWVAFGLVVVNFLAILALVYLAIRVCREVNRSPYWSLVVLLVPGLIGSLSRDLTEIVSALLIVIGVMALREDKYWVVAVAWSLAGLTRETNILAAACLALVSLWAIATKRRRVSQREIAWVVPGLVFVLWQVIAHHSLGTYPLISSSGTGDLGLPFVGFIEGASHWLPSTHPHLLAKMALYSVETLVTGTLLVTAFKRRRCFDGLERMLIVVFSLLVICETRRGWQVPFDNRYATVPLILIWFGLLRGTNEKQLRRVLWIAPLVLVTVAWRVVVI